VKLDPKVRDAIRRRDASRAAVVPQISPAVFMRGVRADLPRIHSQTVLPILEPEIKSCDNCGACCTHMGYPPFVGMYEGEHEDKSDPEWLRLKATHPELAAEALQGAKDNRGGEQLPCLWLDPVTRQCMHYDQRPAVCREFIRGEDACIEHRQRIGIA
jgi:Fe-S-cluster containining protein